MIAEDFINNWIPIINLGDSPEKVTAMMDDLHISQLPVVDDKKFHGIIASENLSRNYNQSIADFELIGQKSHVYSQQHFYDVIRVATDYNVKLVAVLDHEHNFIGIITLEDLIKGFSYTSAVQSPGGIIEITMKFLDYSMAEITRLIESNDVKILSSYIINDPSDNNNISLTIKMDKSDVSHVVATLERFGYTIKGQYQEEKILSNEEERLGMLMKYLNI